MKSERVLVDGQLHVKHWQNVVSQTLSYMRQMLEEQPDRRFVIGLAICFDEMIILLSDRSGILATSAPININKEPLSFIRVIAGLRCMTPEQLGWDTGMKLYKPLDGERYDLQCSYAADEELKKKDRYHRHWVFDVVVEGSTRQYLSVRVLSALGLGEMCGRATIVYEVIEFEKRFKPTETFALKRYWRPLGNDESGEVNAANTKEASTYPSEGQIYEILNQGHIIAQHDITVSAEVDNTFTTIRHGLVPKVTQVAPGHVLPPAEDVLRENSEDAENFLHLTLTSPRVESKYCLELYKRPKRHEIVARVHTQILMPVGYVVKFFCDLRELIWVLYGCSMDYSHAYGKLIVHRDISIGNVMIFPTAADPAKTRGRLMDFDHAKKANDSRDLVCASVPSQSDLFEIKLVMQLVRGSLAYLRESNDLVVADEVIEELFRWVPQKRALDYIKEVIDVRKRHFGLDLEKLEGPLTLAHLGWDHDKIEKCPDFSTRVPRNGERTGTLPFMSADVLNKRWTWPVGSDMPPFNHDAVHDMESLLWVLTYLCLTRRGPGMHMLREELDIGHASYDSTGTGKLYQAVHTYFEAKEDNLKEAKAKLILLKVFEEEIVPLFHPYFEPLKPLVIQWFATLTLAYMHRGYEYYNIHHLVTCLLKKTHDALPIPAQPDPATTEELQRRETYRQRGLQFFIEMGTVDMPPSPAFTSARYHPVTNPEASASDDSPETPTETVEKSVRMLTDLLISGSCSSEHGQ
ncbi:hypothetical protein D9615_010678 [Tricholomella constricta]|uniref:Fungal-type protein kinase domain-containing protein n=1 Tax=Tricholomella constricta TaxID=117010 RepID=A0A8H5LRP5_9AGAR|nr:hypothetical protein D9615_010678 [Tricholomella constricta]